VATLRRQLEQLKRQPAPRSSSAYAQTLAAYDAATAALADQLELPHVAPFVEPAPDPPPSVRGADTAAGAESAARVVAALQGGLGANTRLLNARALDEGAQERCACGIGSFLPSTDSCSRVQRDARPGRCAYCPTAALT